MMKGEGVARPMMKAVDPRLLSVQDEVRGHFGWSHDDDAASAKRLLSALSGSSPFSVQHWSPDARQATLQRLVRHLKAASEVIVVGAAAEPEDVKAMLTKDSVVVAADGAVGACHDVVPVLCVVTDLDGGEHLERAAREGVPLIVHAHGDNLDTWPGFLEMWSSLDAPPPLVLTHQTREHLPDMHNTGGFTDGDRAVCMLLAAGVTPNRIRRVGFSTHRVGRWSGVTEPTRKLDKLKWMERILGWILPRN